MAITKLPRGGIKDNAINASKIEDGTIAAAEISGTISAAKLNATLDISSKTVTLPNTSVTSGMLAGSIANDKLANNAITIRGTSRALGTSVTIGVDVDWQSVITSNTTMVANRGYFVNTTSGAISMTLPASAAIGDTIAIKDYAGTFASNNLSILRNSHNIQGNANNSVIKTARASLVLVYVDATKGWLFTDEHNVADLQAANFTAATGGTVTTSGDFKIHTFTGDGNFVVSSVGNAPVPGAGPNSVDYLVVAGGAGGSGWGRGGGGAGGFRTSYPSPAGVIAVTATTFPITVGAGGSGTSNGSNSAFSTITSAGGGGGVGPNGNGSPGGSGGGGGIRCFPGPGSGSHTGNKGNGNTPPVSPPQGNNGGDASPRGGPAHPIAGGGGGGAGGAGAQGDDGPPGTGGNGGAGTANSITGSSVTRAGGGGGGVGRHYGPSDTFVGGTGGSGGGGNGETVDGLVSPKCGSANTGGGAGSGGAGGKGVVIIRYKFQ